MPDYTGTENLEIMADAIKYNRFLISLIQNEARADEKIVDFGAGIGTFAELIIALGYKVHCIEPDSRQLSRISEKNIPAYKDLTQIKDASIDLIYTFNVLEHIEDDVAALSTCYEKLKPGGRILIYVPAFQVLFSSMDKSVGHFRRYTRTQLSEKVRMAGLEIVKNEYVDCAGFFASLLFKISGNEHGTINRKSLIFYDRYVFPLSRFVDRVFNGILGKNVYLIARRP